MRCDIKFLIGGFNTPDTAIEISKTESDKELDSILDIVEFLMNSDETRAKLLIAGLNHSEVIATEDLNKILDTGSEIIGNVTISDLKAMYPEIMSKFTDHGEKYTFALRDQAYLNGDELKGRIEHKGRIVYFLRNENDIKHFVNTERKKALIKKFITNEGIKLDLPKFSEYLNAKYSGILKQILSTFNKNRTNKLNLQQLLVYFLDHKDEFSIGGIYDFRSNTRSIGEILNNFCLELSNNRVYDFQSDSPLVKLLKFINFKMDSFGKKDFFETLKSFGLEMSEEQFANLKHDQIRELFKQILELDPSLKYYSIDFVDPSSVKEATLTKDEILDLVNLVNIIRKSENPDFEEFKYNAKTVKYSELEEFLGDYLDSPRTILDKTDLSLTLKKGAFGKPKIVYSNKSLDNDNKIKLKYKGQSLENLFGHVTTKTFIPVNSENVINGIYKGYHIYEHTDPKTKIKYYIASKSIIRPNLYTKNIYGSLQEVLMSIDGIEYGSPIKNSVILSIHDAWYQGKVPRNIEFNKYLGLGSTIETLYYPVEAKKLAIPNEELLNLNFESASNLLIAAYPELNIKALNTSEKLALFIYKMNNLGIYPNSMSSKSETNITELTKAIEDITNAPTKYHIVEKTINSNIYLKKLDPNTLNSDGTVANPGKTSLEKGKYISTIGTLYKLKELLLNSLFKDSSIKIEIMTNDQLKALKGPNNKPLLDTVEGVKGFVHNNTIYINSDIASTGDMIHEAMHFTLGAIRVKSPETYENLVAYFSKKASSLTWDAINNKYPNLALIDKMEEVAVRYIANQLYNGTFAYNDDMSEVMKDLESVFQKVLQSINDALSDDSKSDIGFTNLFNLLFLSEDVLTDMLERRITTNIILNKMNSEIYEKCDK